MPHRKIVPLGEIAEEITVGYVGPMANEYVESGVPFLRSLNIRPFRFEPTELKFISPEFHHKIRKSALKPGDVAVVRTGNPGVSCVIPEELADANCSDLVVIRPGEKLDPEFVSYYINSITKSHIKGQLVGAIQQHFNIGAAKEIHFPNISRQEQKKLSSTLTALDAKIALNHRINGELEGMAKLLYDYWFVQYDFPLSAAQAAALGKPHLTGKPYRSSGGPMVYHDHLKREIPKGWEVKPIESVLAKEAPSKKVPASEILNSGSIPVIDQSKDFICGFTNDEDALIRGTPKIIFGDHTRILKFINFDFARGADGTQMIASNSESMPPHLFYHSLLKIDLSSYGYARHFKFLKQSNITLPDSNIAQKFEEIVAAHYQLIRANTFQNQELTTLRDWLLPMLMNGQVRVG